MKKRMITCLFLLLISACIIGCQTGQEASENVENGDNEDVISSVVTDETELSSEDEEIIEKMELLPIVWNEPEVVNAEITYEEACAYIDALLEKYEEVNVDYFIQLNYYSLSESTISKLQNRYADGFWGYSDVYMIEGYFDKYTGRVDNMSYYMKYVICDHFHNDYYYEGHYYYNGEYYLDPDTDEIVNAPEVLPAEASPYVPADEYESYCFTGLDNVSSWDEAYASEIKLSDYIMDENLKLQADAIDWYGYEYTKTYMEMMIILSDIMETFPLEEAPDYEYYNEFIYYTMAMHFTNMEYIEENPYTYTEYMSEEEKEFIDAFEIKYQAFLSENADNFELLKDKSIKLENIYGSLCAYIEDKESDQYPCDFVFSFNSSQCEGTNLETLRLMTAGMLISMHEMDKGFVPEWDDSWEAVYSRSGLGEYFGVNPGNVDARWGVGLSTCSDVKMEFLVKLPREYWWEDKDEGLPSTIHYMEGYYTDYECGKIKEGMMTLTESYIRSEGWNVNEMKFGTKTLKEILIEYEFEQEWIDKIFK